MDDTLRAHLAAELAEAGEPPLGDLVEASVHQGVRLRRSFRIKAVTALTGVAVLAVTATAAVMRPGPWQDAIQPSASGRAIATPAAPSPSVSDTLPATPAAIMEVVARAFPSMRVDRRQTDRGSLNLRMLVTTGDGQGALTVSLYPTPPAASSANTQILTGDKTVTVQTGETGKCSEGTAVTVGHPNGTTVRVELDQCQLDRRETDPGLVPVLTVYQATDLAADDRWGLSMERALVDAGAQHHPDIPVVG